MAHGLTKSRLDSLEEKHAKEKAAMEVMQQKLRNEIEELKGLVGDREDMLVSQEARLLEVNDIVKLRETAIFDLRNRL